MRHVIANGLILTAALLVAVPGQLLAQPEELWASTRSNNLINFFSDNPGACAIRPMTGFAVGEHIVGIDFRPKPPLMRLYALANTGQLYLISDPNSGVATAVGPGPAPMLSGSEFGVDFNPTVDRIRVVSNANQNLRMHPDTGALAATDMNLNYAVGDANAGVTPQVAAGAYTNNFDGAPSTVLNDIDTGLDILTTQTPPNNGTLNTVGSLGVDASEVNGFDISGRTGTAYAALRTGAPAQSTLYTIDLATGAASPVGLIGCATDEPIRGLSVGNDLGTPVEPSTWGRIKQTFEN